MEVYIEDLIDYCAMNNWYDASKDTEEERWIKADKAMACLRASLPPAVRTVYKYSLGLSEIDQKKPHRVIHALKEYYGASTGIFGERQKFLRLLQHENESVGTWEYRVRNHGAQCEYEAFADQLMRDQFIAGLVSEPLRVKLIGKGHRHRECSRAKVSLQEVVKVAKAFEATTFTNQLMKTAQGTQEQVNYNNKTRQNQTDENNQHKRRRRVFGAVVIIANLASSTVQRLERDVIYVARLVISHGPAERELQIEEDNNSQTKSKTNERRSCMLQKMEISKLIHHRNLK